MTTTDTKNPDAGSRVTFEHMQCPYCREYIKYAVSKPPEQGQVEAIEGLDEAIRCVAQWPVYSDMPRHKVAWVNTVLEAARRYSELARGKGGV